MATAKEIIRREVESCDWQIEQIEQSIRNYHDSIRALVTNDYHKMYYGGDGSNSDHLEHYATMLHKRAVERDAVVERKRMLQNILRNIE